MTRRRWIADEWDEASAWLRGEQAAHLIRVLRAQAGMECEMVAGNRVWRAVIAGVSGDTVRFTLLGEVAADAALRVTVLLSVFKFDRMEWVIEKVTELGVERIVPMIARRSEKHLAQAAQSRVERWRRIVREAAQQSRRSDVPAIDDVIALKQAVGIRPETGTCLLLAEQERERTLYQVMQDAEKRSIHIAVGPEGGWTAEEESLFIAGAWQPVSLGPRILRAETAAIAAVSVLAAMVG